MVQRNPQKDPFANVVPVPQREKPEVFTCKKCGNSWMKQVVVQQYPKHYSVILGQELPATADLGFFLLECVKCGEVYEPNIQIGPRDSARKKYDEFWDIMEKDRGDIILGTKKPDGESV